MFHALYELVHVPFIAKDGIVVDEENSEEVLAIINEDPDNNYILMDTDGTLNSLLPGILDEAEHVGNYNIHWDVLDTYILSN